LNIKKNILYIILIAFLTGSLLSAPLKNVPLKLVQPDGTILNVFASGDEFYNWVHDKDDFTIVIDKSTGYYVYAVKQNDELLPSAYIVGRVNPNFTNLEKGVNYSDKKVREFRATFNKQNILSSLQNVSAPLIGEMNNIVIFIRFSDEFEFTDNISKYDEMFNATNNSMKNYFAEASYNQMNISTYFFPQTAGAVISYQDKYPRAYYQPYDSIKNLTGYKISGADNRTTREHELLASAIKSIGSQVPANLNIDRNNDGWVDNICFIISGGNDAWNTLLWPHRWSLYTKTVLLNGKRVYDYNVQIQQKVSVGVFCHEMFHTFGSPDLYHYASDSKYSPCGNWDIMCSGSAHMSAYMKYKYGKWITKIDSIEKPGTYVLNPLTSPSGNCYKIKSSKSDSEYFLLEYRKQSGSYESQLPGSGLLVYRVNTKQGGNSNGPPDELYLYRPDGSVTANGKLNDAFFNRTVNRYMINENTNPAPFLTNGNPGGLNISDVGESGQTISFTVSFGQSSVVTNPVESEKPEMFSLGQNYPNPFNPHTVISYQLSTISDISLKVYDVLGKEVVNLVNEKKQPGKYSVDFNPEKLPGGLYFYQLKAGRYNSVRRMLYIK
jgi:M6 family metalloprotease-like protein